MKTITFRPLRRIKKTGKITVASYMQWRKVKTADYSSFNLVIDDEYKKMPKDEYVHDHAGELLFWFNHTNPETLPLNYVDIDSIIENTSIESEYFKGEEYKFTEPIGKGFHYLVRGFDCDGVPVFSHYSQDYVAKHFEDVSQFEPVTVEMVTKWLGWFLYQLNNSYLQIGK